MKKNDIIITPAIAFEKMKSWCAYQERSQKDAKGKLYELGIKGEEADAIIAELITENFINEERFAKALANGKFRIKHWGKIKIRGALRQHQVTDYCIKTALNNIDEKEYEAVIIKVIEKKLRLTKVKDKRKLFYEVLKHAASKGFESDLVIEQLNVLLVQEK